MPPRARRLYMVDASAAQALIPAAFEVVEAAPGKTQATIVIVDYRDNDLGDYDEVGIVFFVRPAGQHDAVVGSYIHKLPVNQSFTCEAGFKIWGFPKTVEEIDFNYADDSATCKLVMGGKHVLTLTVPRGGTVHKTTPKMIAYAAGKSALNAITKTLARDLGPSGIRVNAVAPGFTKTSGTEDLWGPDDGKAAGESLLLGRMTEAQDIANAVAFLLSSEARQITGQILDVDGGNHLMGGGYTPMTDPRLPQREG